MLPEQDQPLPVPGPGAHRISIHGHDRALASLRAVVAGDRLAQAVLFAGPPAVGKRSVARWLAQLVMCTSNDDASPRPCGHCRACRLVASGGWPDLHCAESPLRIDAVRGLQHNLALAPNEAQVRVVILPNVELASPGAANCLLKTLEEPPRHAVLLLTTNDPGAVLPTVRSRCQRVSLRPMPIPSCAQVLQAVWGAEAQQAELLARLAGGRLGWAVRAIEDESIQAGRAVWLDGLARARTSGVADRMALAAELARAKDGLAAGLALWASWWRDVMLLAHGLEGTLVNQDRRDEVEQAARQYGSGPPVAFLRSLDTALQRLAANAGAQLTLEVLVLEMP